MSERIKTRTAQALKKISAQLIKKTGIKNLKLYLWIGLVYCGLAWLTDALSEPGTFRARFWNDIWRTVYIAGISILLYEYIIPSIRKRRGVILKIISSLATVLLYVFFFTVGGYAWRGMGIVFHIFTPLTEYKSLSEGASEQFGLGLFSVLFFGFIRHVYNYLQLQRTAQQLRIEKQEAELNYLKSQTNPHFLFNTLNNIYSLARDKSDLAPESILRLSKMLRYMLYETTGAYVAIEQELRIISDYIALEQLRYDETLQVNFNHDIEDMKQSLPPLLLIPLVENAFKHGVAETRSQPFVDIHLSVRNRRLTLQIRNSLEVLNPGTPVKENIGLSNLRRQLELLYTDYQLTVQQGSGFFSTVLTINLNSHV